jgi:hypothetical protein
VILFDGADCRASDSLGRVNITSCTTSIFDEIKPAGSIDLLLQQDKTYYLAFENGNNANATVSADFVDYYSLPIKPMTCSGLCNNLDILSILTSL